MKKRVRITVTGRVQGVGFRPTVYRYAAAHGLSGFVRNTSAGVVAEVEGEEAAISGFLRQLAGCPPPPSRIDRLEQEDLVPSGHGGFRIEPSHGSGDLMVGIPPDLATCEDCARELLDRADRRFRYPFINCTNCGPRFTIARELPYDREKTSMSCFTMCPACSAEYADPADRRFDAQPNACAACGPSLALLAADGSRMDVEDPLEETVRRIAAGAVAAVKSLGGYHLCCDARSDQAVGLLRERKRRPAKPLAVMFASMDELREHAVVGEPEAAALRQGAAPVVIVPRRPGSSLSRLVSPDTDDVGAFLPYTPLHHLLLAGASPLVMTSGNWNEEPIAKDEDELRRILGPLADVALVHDRPIVRRCDDSVLKIVRGRRLFFRRSRGWVPEHIALPVEGAPVLACGAELKSTLCLTRGTHAFMSQHIGDLVEYSSYRFFEEVAADFARLLGIVPRWVAHDLHPDYASTRFARAYPADRRMPVQHHHAHIASGMAEHNLTGPVIGVALDGTGLGADGTIWGGEFLVADLVAFRRAAHFKPYRLPGGDEAVRHPDRMALAVLTAEFGGDEGASLAGLLLPRIPGPERVVLDRMIRGGVRSPWTSSAGRLFDAVSALLGLCGAISYEAQAAVRLQAAAARATGAPAPYAFRLEREAEPWVLSFGPMIREIVSDLREGADRAGVAARFHRTLAAAVGETCEALRGAEGLGRVVLSGGVFQNDLLQQATEDELKNRGFEVYSQHLVPPNDGGLALGQAAVALATVEREGRK